MDEAQNVLNFEEEELVKKAEVYKNKQKELSDLEVIM